MFENPDAMTYLSVNVPISTGGSFDAAADDLSGPAGLLDLLLG